MKRGLIIIVAATLLICTASLSPNGSDKTLATVAPAEVNWQAQWIGSPWEGEEYDKDIIQPAPEFRKQVTIQKRIRKATANVTGLGFFEFFVNGKKVGDDVLSPNETSYGHRTEIGALDDSNWRNFRVFYLSHDITKMLRKGENTLGALVGNGFYATGRTRWVSPYGTPRFICQIEIEYQDGTTETIISDQGWQVRKSPIILNDVFDGEIYDARQESNEEWQQVAIRKSPDGKLMLQDGPADRVIETLHPQSIQKLDDGRWEVDFGDYVSGWVRLYDFTLAKGNAISIEFPIESAGNGEYKYIGNGHKTESYAPRFCWWVFEKAIISGWPGELKPENIVAEVVHSDVPVSAHFDCSNPLLKSINEIWKRAMTDNMHVGVPTDCPHREKGPYTGDGQASCVTAMHNFAAAGFYRKWLHDMTDCQDLETGYVPNGAPWHPGCGGGVPWGSAMCIIPWEHYLHYGDIGVLEENFGAMCEYVRHMQTWILPDGTMFQQLPSKDHPDYWLNLGEWCVPYNLPSENLVHTWFLWRCADYTAKAAEALGRAEEAADYNALAEATAKAFHAKFYDPAAGGYTSGTGILDANQYGTGEGGGMGDGSNIFALAMGVPEECRSAVIKKVKEEFEANGGHLNTGIYASGLYFEVLCDIGLAEEAYEAMTKTDFPSFGWWVEQGAKTTWEQWNGRDSRCHQMFGGALVWMYRRICGVRTDESAPGYKHIIVKPTPVGDLTWASYDTQTPQGTLAVRWDRDDTDFVLKITVPKGSTATVYMPDGSAPVELNPGTTRLKARLSTLSDNPQIAAVQQLARRTLGSKASGIVFSEIPSDSLDVFTIESTEDGKILISGNNASAMSCGLNHYLRYCCGVEVGVACLRKV